MCLALQDAFPEAYDLRPHHMSLDDVKGEPGAVRMEQISKRRTRLWKSSRLENKNVDPAQVQNLITGQEHIFSAVRNPYDFFVTCFVRRGRGAAFVNFLKSYREDPYVRGGRLYYHKRDCDTVLRHETLQADLNTLMKKLDLLDVPLERHNETKDKKPWETYYTPETFRAVNTRFEQDFCGFYEPRTE